MRFNSQNFRGPGGYFIGATQRPLQCTCGFVSVDKPQDQWTEEDYEREAAHQQMHLAAQAPHRAS